MGLHYHVSQLGIEVGKDLDVTVDVCPQDAHP